MKNRVGASAGEPLSRVFVLDDEEVVLKAVARILKRAGFEVMAFLSPEEFLRQATLEPPCCLVLDVHMPGMNGVELQARLAGAEQPPSIVFMSGKPDVPSTVKAMKAGAIDFLAKPFEPGELVAAVGAGLRRSAERLTERLEAAKALALLSRLTPREREVCDLVATGMRSKEIADALGTAVKTVNIHRSRVMSKLRAGSVVDLVRLLEQAGQRPA